MVRKVQNADKVDVSKLTYDVKERILFAKPGEIAIGADEVVIKAGSFRKSDSMSGENLAEEIVSQLGSKNAVVKTRDFDYGVPGVEPLVYKDVAIDRKVYDQIVADSKAIKPASVDVTALDFSVKRLFSGAAKVENSGTGTTTITLHFGYKRNEKAEELAKEIVAQLGEKDSSLSINRVHQSAGNVDIYRVAVKLDTRLYEQIVKDMKAEKAKGSSIGTTLGEGALAGVSSSIQKLSAAISDALALQNSGIGLPALEKSGHGKA